MKGKTGKKAAEAPLPAPALNEFLLAAGLLWLALLAALFSPQAMQAFHAAVRLLTEGNSYAKSVLFAAFLAICLTIRGIMAAGAGRFFTLPADSALAKNARTAFLAAVAASMMYGVLLQMFFLGMLGANANSYVSHVTQCGENWCWEGNYLQHNHVTKTALFFVEKYSGLALGPQVDNGQPMYEIVPFADWAAPVTLLLLAAVAVTGFAAVLREKNALNALLLGMVAGLFTIATVDGGIFTQTGISGATLLAIYLWREKKGATAEERFAVPLALGALVGFLPNLLLKSPLVYYDWFPGMIVASAFFAFVDAERGWKRVTLLGVLLFSSLFFAGHVFDKAYGAQATIYRTSSLAEGLPGAPNLVVYGLPPQTGGREVEARVPEINFTASAKYGWYFVGSANASAPIKITTLELQERMRAAYPGGYLYVEENHNAHAFRQVYIVWNRRPEKSPDYSLFSMKVLKVEERGTYTVLSGIAAASGSGLGLEVGSYVRSMGGDATVITGVV